MSESTHFRTCPLCEASCGLSITVEGDVVTSVRGDTADHFSEGYVCPKGTAIGELHADPDRIRTPMIREGNDWRAATWDEAFSLINEKLPKIVAEQGKNAVAMYLGNPSVHNTESAIYTAAFLRQLRTQNVYSASTVDQIPKQLTSAAMFGTGLSIPIPDLDRTQYLLVVGGNPLVSNGSLMTAANVGERLARIRKRGGKITVVDPVRTKTAKAADEHIFVRPGSDAYFLFAIAYTLFEENLVDLGAIEEHLVNVDAVKELAQGYAPEGVAARCGIDADTIKRIAREVAGAESAAVYSRMGASTQEFGTLANWLADVINILTGNLDRPGGVLFAQPAHGAGNAKGTPGKGKGLRTGRWSSRVSGAPEIFNELPCTCLAEEIETPGEGQVRALITNAANPVLSIPNGQRLAAALETLEFMVSIDIYMNETTRHAHVILPDVSPLQRCHFDMAFAQLSVSNHTKYSAPIFEVPEGQIPSWHIPLRLAAIVAGAGTEVPIEPLDEMFIKEMIQREIGLETSPIHGRDPGEILAAMSPRTGPQRAIDFLVRTGPYGDGFGANPDGLSMDVLEANPHGIDLGPLEPRVPEVLRTPTGKIDLAPDFIVEDCERLLAGLDTVTSDMLLIGRRQLRSNNSWMHNIPKLMTGKPRCTLLVNDADADRLGLQDGAMASVATETGSIQAPVERTEDIMQGVVSLPHGWGHVDSGTQMSVAQSRPGANVNAVIDHTLRDVPSGNSILNGIPVQVGVASANEEAAEAVAAK